MFPVMHRDQAHHILRLNHTSSGVHFLIRVVPRMAQVPRLRLLLRGLLRLVAGLPIFARLILARGLFR